MPYCVARGRLYPSCAFPYLGTSLSPIGALCVSSQRWVLLASIVGESQSLPPSGRASGAGHKNYSVSHAGVRHCIFCNYRTASCTFHVLGSCRRWDSLRAGLPAPGADNETSRAKELAAVVLKAAPEDAWFTPASFLALAVERAAGDFWKRA